MRTNQGLIKAILIIIIALIVLGYFGFNVQDIINSPTVHNNLIYAWNLVVTFWNNYLQAPIMYLWNNFMYPSLHNLGII